MKRGGERFDRPTGSLLEGRSGEEPGIHSSLTGILKGCLKKLDPPLIFLPCHRAVENRIYHDIVVFRLKKNNDITSWRDISCMAVDETIRRQVYSSSNFQVVRYILNPGASIEPHSHPEEQLTMVASGVIRYRVEEETLELRAGDIIKFGGGVVHELIEVLNDEVAITLNLFFPPKRDFLDRRRRTVEG